MLALLLAAAISYTLHAKDVFQPPKPPALEAWRAPAAVGSREAVEFQSKEGAPLRGWLYMAEPSAAERAPWVIFFYGSNEDLAHEANRLAWLRDTFHVNAICFDAPGYGFSKGAVSVAAIRSAALEEFDYVQEHLAGPAGAKPASIIVYGWSIGTGMAVHVAAERKVAGMILQAPPATAEAMEKFSSRHEVPWYAHGVVSVKADDEVRALYENAAAVHGIMSPLLVIHGALDDVVPVEQGRAVFTASPAAKKVFVEVPQAHHNDLRFKDAPASTAVGRFLEGIPKD